MATGTRNSKRNTRVARPRSSALFGRSLMRRFYQQHKATAHIKRVIGGDLRSRIWFVGGPCCPPSSTRQNPSCAYCRVSLSCDVGNTLPCPHGYSVHRKLITSALRAILAPSLRATGQKKAGGTCNESAQRNSTFSTTPQR